MPSRSFARRTKRTPLGITHLYVSDEEIGSPTSQALIEAEGHKAKYVLVTEPARDGGKIVTGRKGVARFEVFVTGLPAHAGTRPQDGRSAVRELANVIQALEAMTDFKRGVTVNVGVVRGGTKPNVIPEQAYAEVDLRVMTIADADEFVAKILNLKSRTEGVTVKVTGELNRPPYEKGNAGAALYEHAQHARCGNRLRPPRYLSAAAAPTAISPPPSPRRSTVSASMAKAHIRIMSSCISRRSSRGRGCCIGCIRRCDEQRRPRFRRPRPMILPRFMRRARSSDGARATNCARIRPI